MVGTRYSEKYAMQIHKSILSVFCTEYDSLKVNHIQINPFMSPVHKWHDYFK